MATTYFSTSTGEQQPAWLKVALDDTRRKFNFGDRVAEIEPRMTPFFIYASRLRSNSTDDPVFKMLEHRHQWQRRYFEVETNTSGGTFLAASPTLSNIPVGVKYDKYGRESDTYQQPLFLLKNQVVVIEGKFSSDGGATYGPPVPIHLLITDVHTPTATNVQVDGKVLAIDHDSDFSAYDGNTVAFDVGFRGQVIGTAFPEASKYPDSWKDELLPTEGYCQIFKTASPMWSGTAMATRYRGYANEMLRVWRDKLKEHKMDIEHALLFGVGRVDGVEDGVEPKRYTWGIVSYASMFGVVHQLSYSSSGYNDFIDFFEYFYAPERGNSNVKLWLTSRPILAWLQKLGSDSFLGNTLAQSIRFNLENVQGRFGHQLLRIDTIFGTAVFAEEPLFRGVYEDYAVGIDLQNIAYRPLVGNGISRDTFIETNVQDPGVDGRIDQIITEAGLEITLPETHAILKFS